MKYEVIEVNPSVYRVRIYRPGMFGGRWRYLKDLYGDIYQCYTAQSAVSAATSAIKRFQHVPKIVASGDE